MSSEKLYSPLKVGAITAANRIFMAPLTRLRSIEPGDIPTPLMAEYYRQRASAGLIISEATQISAQAKGYAGAPGIHSPEQIAAWKKITAGVHAENGHMAVQLWHTGRISHASLQPGGQAPVAPSALSAGTRTSLRDENGQAIRVETSMPRALELEEIPGIVNDFRQAIANAREAGFDLVDSTLLTVICCISSFPLLQTIVPISTAAAWKIARVWCWKWSMPGLKNGVPIALAFAFRQSVLSRTRITARMKKPMHCI